MAEKKSVPLTDDYRKWFAAQRRVERLEKQLEIEKAVVELLHWKLTTTR